MKRDFSINARVAKIIDEKGIKKSFVAEKIGIQKESLTRILNGKRSIYASEVLPLCEALGVNLEELLYGDDKSA